MAHARNALIKNNLIHRYAFFGGEQMAWISEGTLYVSKNGNSRKVDLLDIITYPILTSGLIWSEIEVPTRNGSVKVSGLRATDAVSAFEKHLTKALVEAHCAFYKPKMDAVVAALDALKALGRGRYVKKSEIDRWVKSSGGRGEVFSKIFYEHTTSDAQDILDAYKYALKNYKIHKIKSNERYLKEAKEEYRDYFATVEKNPLTSAQVEACIKDEDNNLVLAGAGSGKTSVIVAKAGFVEKVGWAAADQILILAYGRKASRETQERIRERLGKSSEIKASTFHSLGLFIIGQATGQKPRLSQLSESDDSFSRYVDGVVGELSIKHSEYQNDLIDYFSNYLYPLRLREAFHTENEYYEHLKQHPPITIDGVRVKSLEEVQVANFLYRNGIEYVYEADYKYSTAGPDYSQYRPDFYLPKYDVYIEHIGIDRDGTPPPFMSDEESKAYILSLHWKRKIHTEKGTKLVESYSYQFRDDTIFKKLRRKLEEHEVVFNPRPPEEILEALRTGENIRKVAKLIADFINLQKGGGKTLGEVVEIVQGSHKNHPLLQLLGYDDYLTKRLKAFIRIYKPVYSAYEEELRGTGTVDFNDMINEATRLVRERQFKSRWRYILIDEFQDISASRAKLIKSLRETREDSVLFCVGDDWQSIYRFTGADVSYTKCFEDNFGTTATTPLGKTFRFNDGISALATRFVMKNDGQVSKVIEARAAKHDQPTVSLVLHNSNVMSSIRYALSVIQESLGGSGAGTVYFIGRYRHQKPEEFADLQDENRNLDIQFDTVHSSKGKEADFVVLLGLDRGKYGFPSEVQSDPILDIMLPEPESYPDAEERRLFYVGITRARDLTFILSDINKPSRFAQELLQEAGEYRCAVINSDGDAVDQDSLVCCEKCDGGVLSLKVNPNNDSSFYGCSNYPLCSNTLSICDKCSNGPMVPTGNCYVCSHCGSRESMCPQCGSGRLMARSGTRGDFLGCSNYRGKQEHSCEYTKNILASSPI